VRTVKTIIRAFLLRLAGLLGPPEL
jgi:hypothetical protein